MIWESIPHKQYLGPFGSVYPSLTSVDSSQWLVGVGLKPSVFPKP